MNELISGFFEGKGNQFSPCGGTVRVCRGAHCAPAYYANASVEGGRTLCASTFRPKMISLCEDLKTIDNSGKRQ